MKENKYQLTAQFLPEFRHYLKMNQREELEPCILVADLEAAPALARITTLERQLAEAVRVLKFVEEARIMSGGEMSKTYHHNHEEAHKKINDYFAKAGLK